MTKFGDDDFGESEFGNPPNRVFVASSPDLRAVEPFDSATLTAQEPHLAKIIEDIIADVSAGSVSTQEPGITIDHQFDIQASVEQPVAQQPPISLVFQEFVDTSIRDLLTQEPTISIDTAFDIQASTGVASVQQPATSVDTTLGVSVESVTVQEPGSELPGVFKVSLGDLSAVEPRIGVDAVLELSLESVSAQEPGVDADATLQMSAESASVQELGITLDTLNTIIADTGVGTIQEPPFNFQGSLSVAVGDATVQEPSISVDTTLGVSAGVASVQKPGIVLDTANKIIPSVGISTIQEPDSRLLHTQLMSAAGLTAVEPAPSLDVDIGLGTSALTAQEPALDAIFTGVIGFGEQIFGTDVFGGDVSIDLSTAALTAHETTTQVTHSIFPTLETAAIQEPRIGVNVVADLSLGTVQAAQPTPELVPVRLSLGGLSAVELSPVVSRSLVDADVESITAARPPMSFVDTDVSVTASTGSATVQATSAALVQNDWTFDNVPTELSKRQVTDVTVTPTALELTWLSHITGISDLRTFNDFAGDTSRIVQSDGGWTTIDTALDDSNTVTVSPPKSLIPTIVSDTFLVEDYVESDRAAGNVSDVRVTLMRKKPRDPESSTVLVQTQDTDDEWKFVFYYGTITPVLVQRTDQEDEKNVRLEMNVSSEQAEVIFESANRLDAVSEETVPDGDDFLRDNHPDNRNTVTIHKATNADPAHIPTDGADYVVQTWRARFDMPFRWDVTMEVR